MPKAFPSIFAMNALVYTKRKAKRLKVETVATEGPPLA
jgi:hypothetical protein